MATMISVITINFNNLAGLQLTLKSIWRLDGDYELIVIDGGSTDGSAEFLSANDDRIDVCVSERDAGIYDAMNKGVLRSQGKWVIFMNSGDWFFEQFDLASLLKDLEHENAQIILGNAIVHYPDGRTRLWKAEKQDNLWKGMVAAHQAIIYQREVVLSFPFSKLYNIAGDFEQLFRVYKAGRTFRIHDVFIANIGPGGISDSRRVETMKELLSVVKNDISQTQKLTLQLGITYQHIIVLVKNIFSLLGIELNRGKSHLNKSAGQPSNFSV